MANKHKGHYCNLLAELIFHFILFVANRDSKLKL